MDKGLARHREIGDPSFSAWTLGVFPKQAARRTTSLTRLSTPGQSTVGPPSVISLAKESWATAENTCKNSPHSEGCPEGPLQTLEKTTPKGEQQRLWGFTNGSYSQ